MKRLWCAVLLCLLFLPLASFAAETSLSPGPKGGLFDRDYRVSVTWLEKKENYAAGDYARRIDFGGRHRFYEAHVPQGYTPDKKYPVVMVIHGGGGNPAVVRYQSGMNDVADKNGFIALYPAGTGSSGYDRKLYWNTGPLSKDEAQRDVDDVGFIKVVLDDIAGFFPVDVKRVYATGISNGGQMSFRLASELSDRITAVAPIAGDRTIGQFFPAPPRAMPVIAFHGMKDTYLPFAGGGTPLTSAFKAVKRIPVTETMMGWVLQAGGDPAMFETLKRGHATRYHYPSRKQGGAEVDFWVLSDGGHTWPGGRTSKVEDVLGVGAVNQDISASELMWDFFKRQQMP